MTTCRRCGLSFEPSPQNSGSFCCRECYERRGHSASCTTEPPTDVLPPRVPTLGATGQTHAPGDIARALCGAVVWR